MPCGNCQTRQMPAASARDGGGGCGLPFPAHDVEINRHRVAAADDDLGSGSHRAAYAAGGAHVRCHLFPKYPRPSQQPCTSPDVFSRLGHCNFQLGAAPPGIIQLGGAVCSQWARFHSAVAKLSSDVSYIDQRSAAVSRHHDPSPPHRQPSVTESVALPPDKGCIPCPKPIYGLNPPLFPSSGPVVPDARTAWCSPSSCRGLPDMMSELSSV